MPNWRAVPETFRLPLLLCFWHGLTQDEAARRLGVTPGAIKGRLERGRVKLAARLARRGIAPALLLTAAGTTPTRELAAGTVELIRPDANVSAAILALARTVSPRLPKFAALAVILFVVVGGFGLRDAWLGATPKSDPPIEKSPAAKIEKPNVDYLGDPLPEGAIARLGTKRLQHGETVQVVAFSPDGQTLVSSGFDGRISFWEAATGREKSTIINESKDRLNGCDPVVDLAYSPDGARLAYVPLNYPPRILDATTRKIVFSLGDRVTRANRVRFLADGKHVVFGRFDVDRFVSALVIADAKSGVEKRLLQLHRGDVTFHWVGVGHHDADIFVIGSDGSLPRLGRSHRQGKTANQRGLQGLLCLRPVK